MKADTPSRLDDCVAGAAGMPYCACKQAGVTCSAQLSGTVPEVAFEGGLGMIFTFVLVSGGLLILKGNLSNSV